MARSSSSASGSETKTPLVVALVFFILATLALGITTYMGFGDASLARADAIKAAQEKATIQTERDKEKEKVIFYKVFTGVNTPEEKPLFDAARFKDDLRNEYTNVMKAMEERQKSAVTKAMQDLGLRGADTPKLEDFFKWQPDAAGVLQAPSSSLIDAAVRANSQRQLAQNNLDVAEKGYADIRKSATDMINALSVAAKNYDKVTAEFPEKIAAEVRKYQKTADETSAKFNSDMVESRKKIQESANSVIELDFEKNKIKAARTSLETQLGLAQAALDATNDPFQFDKPSGKVFRRQIGNKQVEIDLGWADFLKPGIKFSIQPSDTKERGLGNRLKEVKGPDGKPQFRIQAKANIEVVEVTGAHSSVCRITDEFDEIRERVMAGDLLYNSAWRKGSADHVALFGVFDLDADGVDDILHVVTNLNKSGIVVDAYFDLATMKWVGNITERTIFAIEGYVPVLKGLDGNADYKARIISAIDDAKKYCKERGAKVVKIRDFFPRIGYDVNFGITDDRINQAAAKYYTTPAAKDAAAETGK